MLPGKVRNKNKANGASQTPPAVVYRSRRSQYDAAGALACAQRCSGVAATVPPCTPLWEDVMHIILSQRRHGRTETRPLATSLVKTEHVVREICSRTLHREIRSFEHFKKNRSLKLVEYGVANWPTSYRDILHCQTAHTLCSKNVHLFIFSNFVKNRSILRKFDINSL